MKYLILLGNGMADYPLADLFRETFIGQWRRFVHQDSC